MGSSSRVADVVIAGFALWTIGFQASAFLGRSLGELVLFMAAMAVVLPAVRMRRSAPSAARAAPVAAPRDRSDISGPVRAVWLVLALVVSVVGLLPISPEAKWAALTVYCLAAVAWWSRNWLLLCDSDGEALDRDSEWLVWTLAVAGGFLAVLMLEPGPDDAATLNFAVVPADRPWAPLMQGDEMHGVEGLPLLFELYRLESLPALAGAVAWLCGVSVKVVMHRALPFVMGALAVLVHARLARRVADDQWRAVFVCLFALLFFTDWSPFSFMRLVHYGKMALFLVMTPLLVCYAIEFSARPGGAAWRRLAVGQVAALGLSTTGIWAAPLVPGATLLAFWMPTARAGGRLLAGVGASFYIVAVGLSFLALSLHSVDALPQFVERLALPSFWSDSLTQAARSPGLRWVVYASMALAIPLAPGAVARRVLLALALVIVVVLLNPWLVTMVAGITGVTTYWRAFLALPLQLAVAFVVVSPLWAWPGVRCPPPSARVVLSVLLLVGVVLTSPKAYFWPAFDAVETSRFGEGYSAARRIVELSEPGEGVLAPEEVAQWITTFHEPPYPLVVRRAYTYVMSQHLEPSEYVRRMALESYVSGQNRPPRAARLLASAINRGELGVVAIATDARWVRELRRVLRRAGMERDGELGGFEVWTRSR